MRCAIASCELRCAVASCDVRVRTQFFEACDVRACGTFLDLRCAITILHVLKKKCPFFGVNYNSVPQKLRILAIKAIFDPRNPFLYDVIDDSMKIKDEITSFNMRYYMNLIKLRLRLRVATIKKASCVWLRVRRDFGLRSCGCGNSK